MTEPGDKEMVEVDPDLARQAAVELYGLEAVDAVDAGLRRGLHGAIRHRQPHLGVSHGAPGDEGPRRLAGLLRG